MIAHTTTINHPDPEEEPIVITSVLGEINPGETPGELWTRHQDKVNRALDALGYN